MGKHWEKGMYGIENFVSFPAMNFEEHWLSRFNSCLWYFGVEAVGEGRIYKYKQKEEEDTFNPYKGLFV